jgi:hypothetical protein
VDADSGLLASTLSGNVDANEQLLASTFILCFAKSTNKETKKHKHRGLNSRNFLKGIELRTELVGGRPHFG